MDQSDTYHTLVTWIIANGYLFVFLAACVEGPVATAAAGFASALGYFNPFLILLLSILGDGLPDALFYAIGYQGHLRLAERLSLRSGITSARIEKMRTLIETNFTKAIIILKLTPIITPFGFMLVGALRLSFRRFFGITSAITIPKSILFLALGYFFGQLYAINDYLHYAGIILPSSIFFLLLIHTLYQKISALLATKIETLP